MARKVRINKFLRDCQLGSRRKCEKLIEQRLVTVNGEAVSEMATLVDPQNDIVAVDGRQVTPVEDMIYVAASKPRGVLVSASDPFGRETVYDAVRGLPEGIYAVGRLDMDSEGLLLLTNDGKLSHRLTHPRHSIERVYHVDVDGRVGPDIMKQMTDGIQSEDGLLRAKQVRSLREDPDGCTLEVTLTEGKKREIRRMLGSSGFEVRRLRRVRFGAVHIGDLNGGEWRHLTCDEVRALRRLVERAYIAKLKGT
jgi:23S rRNA pseudouridine2605 synthase